MSFCMRNVIRRFVLIIALFYAVVQAASASPFLYMEASLEYQKESEQKAHSFLLSTPKRISNTLQIEHKESLTGERHDLLLRIKATGTPQAAFVYYQKLFAVHGKLSYSCEERACGSSNYWANDIFHESKLYGRDSEQYYLAGRLKIEEQGYFASVYIVTNGRKQHYIYLSYILDEGDKTGPEEVDDKDALQAQDLSLWQQGVFLAKPMLNTQQLAFLKNILAQDNRLSLWLMAYTDNIKGQKVLDASLVSKKALDDFSDEMTQILNIRADRLNKKNIGPFGDKPKELHSNIWFRLFLKQ